MPTPTGLGEVLIGALSGYLNPHADIILLSQLWYGDSTSASATNWDGPTLGFWLYGFNSSAQRAMPIWKVALTSIPNRAEIAEATFIFEVMYKSAPGGYNYTTSGPWTITLYEIEGDLAAGTTALLRKTGTTWTDGGYGPKPAYDYNAIAEGTRVISGAEWAALPTTNDGTRTPFEVDVSGAVQRSKDERGNLELMMFAPWAASGANAVGLNLAYITTSVFANTRLRVRYWPAIGVLSADENTAGRPPSFLTLHNKDIAGAQFRTALGVVEQGSSGTIRKLWGWNFRRSGPRRDVVVDTSRSQHTTISNAGAVSGAVLRSVRVYDYDTGPTPDTVSPNGSVVIEATLTNKVQVTYTDDAGVATVLAEEGTGDTAVTIGADHHFSISSKRALTLLASKWFSAEGTGVLTPITTGLMVGDQWKFAILGDSRTTESVDTLGLVKVCPPTAPNGNTPDTSIARVLSHAYTQQLRLPAYNENIGGTTHGHLPIHDTTYANWDAGAEAWVHMFPTGGASLIDDCHIETVYPSSDGTYPDTLRISRALTAPELALMTADSHVTGGIYLGPMATFQLRRLANAVAVGATTSTLTEAFTADDTPATPESVWFVPAGGGPAEEVHPSSGTTVLSHPALTYGYAAGALVYLNLDVEDPTNAALLSGRPYFVFGQVDQFQDEGFYKGYYFLHEQVAA